MEVSKGLLVAMMFITVLSIGIGNILMALPPLVDRRARVAISRIHLGWLLLLLLMHLNLFWQVLLLLDIEHWEFRDFLYIVSGPVLLLLATSIMLPDPSRASEDPTADFLESARPAFGLLALVMAWIAGFDLAFGQGFGVVTFWNAVALVLFAALASSRSPGFHRAGIGFAWVLFFSLAAARGMGVVA